MLYNIEEDVRLAQKGDDSAFMRLIKNVEGTLYRVSSTILKTDQESLDAAQETILKAYTSISTLKEPKYFKTWITRILIRECTRLIRLKKRIIPVSHIKENDCSPSYENHIELKDAVEHLDHDSRLVVMLYYYEDLSLRCISDILDEKEGTIKSRLSRARKKLANILDEEGKKGELAYEPF